MKWIASLMMLGAFAGVVMRLWFHCGLGWKELLAWFGLWALGMIYCIFVAITRPA